MIAMKQERALELFRQTGTMLEGHFRLTSGRHADRYMQCAHLFEHPEVSQVICTEIANAFRDDRVELVVGPAIGGIILSYGVACALGVRNIFAERDAEDQMCLRRGFAVEPGTRAIVVEDAVTTGGSVKEVIDLLRSCGAEVVGVGCVVDRSAGAVDFGVPLRSVLSMNVPSWTEDVCPLCEKGIPVEKPGSRKK